MQALQTQAKIWTEEMEALRERLASICKKYNINKVDVAAKCGVSRTTISEFISARRALSVEMMKKVERYLTQIEAEKEAEAPPIRPLPLRMKLNPRRRKCGIHRKRPCKRLKFSNPANTGLRLAVV